MDTAEIERQVAQFAATYPFALDPFQTTAIRTFLTGDSVMVAAPTGTGKALAAETPVLTPTGWQAIATLRPGDAVIGANGRPVAVRGVYPQGVRPAYRVTFTDGVSTVCDAEHLWAVNTKWRRHEKLPWRVLTLRQILDEGLTENGGRRHFIPLVQPVEFPETQPDEEDVPLAMARHRTRLTQRTLAVRVGVSQGAIAAWESGRRPMPPAFTFGVVEALEEAGTRAPLDPYALGLLLGDGNVSNGVVRFSSADVEMVESLRALLPEGTKLVPIVGKPYDWMVMSSCTRSRNSLVTALRELGLMGHRAGSKFIPDSYKFAPVAARIALLQGLLDTDASMDPRGCLEYTTVSPVLAEDVTFLIRSLGGRTRICTKKTTGQLAYRLLVKLPGGIEPFRLRRKLARYQERPRKQPNRAIATVEPAGETEMVCIAVAAPDGLFVIDGFVVTHNTVVAEFGIYEGVRRRGRVFYTTPIKALSNQKFRDLRQTYAEGVGLLTGDISENADAQIVVMTTEVLRNMLLQTPGELDAVDVIVFDEIHYLADPERGTTWEEAIILCPSRIQFICLSATVSNAGEIAAWIGRTHRPITLITHLERAVPLALSYFLDGAARPVIDHAGKQVASFPRVGGEVRRRNGGGGAGMEPQRDEPNPNDIVRQLRADKLLPAIYFLFSRRDCERYAELCANLRVDFVADAGTASRAAIERILEAHLGQMGPNDRQLGQVQLIARLVRRGIGFHHAGLLPILKQLVEQLFTRGLMGVVFATDTLALGVNMPARSVVVGRMSKWDGQRTRPLIPNEFQQMAGRAGRRGMDAEGHVIIPYSPYVSFNEALVIATGPLHPVRSAFKVRYNTVLNLWDPPRGERVRQLLGRSLAQFQSARRIRELEDEASAAQGRADAVTRGCLIGHPDGDALLHGYGRLGKAIDAANARERAVLTELDAAREALVSAPWQEPGRQALRNAFRTLVPGSLVHLRDQGWGAYLGRGNGNGVGLFLLLDTVASPATFTEAGTAPDVPPPRPAALAMVQEYRQIDYLTPPGAWVELPPELMALQSTRADLASLVGAALARIRDDAAALELPDLDAWAARHREERARFLAEETSGLEEALAEAHAHGVEATARREAHVCHTCPVRREHRTNLREAERLDRERADLDARLADETSREEERVRSLLRGIANVLHRFGYLQRGEPTAKADTLAGVFDNNGLIITEMLDRGALDGLRPADLAEVFSWFAFDRDFRGANRYQLAAHLAELRDAIDDIERAVIATERQNDLFISTGYNASFFGVLRAWCEGASMGRLTETIELSEGDLVLTINKTLDLMRQVRSMLATTMPQHPLRSVLAAAERLALRDIVAQSYTFGFLPQSPDTSDAETLNLAPGEFGGEAGAGEADEPVA